MGPPERVENLPVALTIAGSDSSGGAGIQADLKVFFALGCHGASALTALTAQNTVGVQGIHAVPGDFVVQQIDSCVEDLGIAVAKTGMLASADIIGSVASAVAKHRLRLVVDPVFVSKHGDALLAEDAVGALKSDLIPLAEVITPNLHEAAALVGGSIETQQEMKEAARTLQELGPRAVLVKGGHLLNRSAVDVLFDGEEFIEIEGTRYDTQDTHGTGCALSAAITARLARGDDLQTAARFAKEFVAGAIRHGLRLGRGIGPVNPGWRLPGAAGSV